MKKHFWLTLITAAMLAGPVLAATPPPPPPPPPVPVQRSITVSGESKTEVAPDRAVLSMSLVSKDKNLNVAKKNNDELVEKLVAITQQLKIPKEKIATSGVYIAPEYSYNNSQQQFVGYTVNRSFRVTMDGLGTHEKLLSAIVDAKIDQVNGVEFLLADPESHVALLRVKAFENAKGKAQALAQAAGGKLGPALLISTAEEGGAFQPRPPMPVMVMAARMGGESSVAPSLPGMVELREAVTVTFGLE